MSKWLILFRLLSSVALLVGSIMLRVSSEGTALTVATKVADALYDFSAYGTDLVLV